MATARKKGRGYEIRVSCGIDINGKKLGKSKTWIPDEGMTQKQIEKELARQKVLFEEEVKNGICPDNKIRFVDFSKRWMDEYAKVNLTIKTYARYEIYLKRINQGIGHLKLKDITPLQLNAFYRSLEADGVNQRKRYDENGELINNGKLAPKTILDHHRVISKILSTAVKWGLLEKNVAMRADPPKVPHREISYLNEQEVRKMLTLLEKEPIQYQTMITLLVYTGIRRGELCGLEWKDIDFENQVMHVVRSAQYIGNKTMITKEPKTKSGIRHFSLSIHACILLKKYKRWQLEQKFSVGDRWEESDRLFTSWNGKPIHPDTVTDWFSKFIKRSGLPYVTLHSLRHTNATLMIAEGTDVCTVSRRLGHANTATTLNIYAHALKSKDREAANTLDNVLEYHVGIG
ncbi:MAG: site-specific integrase [Clostridiales bacterium]|nr:site-specific integrase [Clostridiales bacterium]